MKRAKKNNKGFSLVELIVVVLIIGVIGVALAPQIMKWVDTSKKNTDINNAAVLKSAVQTAIAEWQDAGGTLADVSANAYFVIDKDGKIVAASTVDWADPDTTDSEQKSLQNCLDRIMSDGYPVSKFDSDGFEITVTKGSGKVTVSCGAQPATP